MKPNTTVHAALVASLPIALLLGGCSPSTSGVRADAAPAAPAARPQAATVDGVHAVRIPLRTHSAPQVAEIVREILDLPHHPEVRAIVDEPSTGSVVVIGTDAGIARVHSLLSPALVGGDDDAGVDVVALQHAEAHRLVHAVEEVAPHDVRLAVDEATNSLVVSGPVTSRRKVLALARELDAPGS